MRLARMVLGGAPGGLGGAQRVVSAIEAALEPAGWRVEWYTPDCLPRAPYSRRYPGLNETLRSLTVSRALRRLAPADITISHGMYGLGTPGRRLHVYHGTYAGLAKSCRAGMTRLDYLVARRLNGAMEQWSGRRATRVAVSQRVAREVSAFYGLATHALIHNGIDLHHFQSLASAAECRARFGLPADRFAMLVVGRMDYGKGRDVIGAMLPRLPARVHVVLAAPESSGLEKLPGDRISLIPGVAYQDLPSLYCACDVLLCASLYEGFGLTLLEAWACGRPVVSGRTGIVEELEGQDQSFDACISAVGDAEGLAHSVARLAQDADLARLQVGWAQRVMGRRFGTDHFGMQYLEVVDRVVSAA